MALATTRRWARLSRGPLGRWVLEDLDLTSGSCIEVRVGDAWIPISIEHDGGDYYAIPKAIRLHQGLEAREIGEGGSAHPRRHDSPLPDMPHLDLEGQSWYRSGIIPSWTRRTLP
jgi:hypothetical protein